MGLVVGGSVGAGPAGVAEEDGVLDEDAVGGERGSGVIFKHLSLDCPVVVATSSTLESKRCHEAYFPKMQARRAPGNVASESVCLGSFRGQGLGSGQSIRLGVLRAKGVVSGAVICFYREWPLVHGVPGAAAGLGGS